MLKKLISKTYNIKSFQAFKIKKKKKENHTELVKSSSKKGNFPTTQAKQIYYTYMGMINHQSVSKRGKPIRKKMNSQNSEVCNSTDFELGRCKFG